MPVTVTASSSTCYQLGPELRNIRQAREQARKALGDWSLGDHAGLAELVVSELVTNAMCHGAGPVAVRLSCAAGRLRAEVHDDGAGRPVRRHATGDDETGRGLELLDGLTRLHGGELGVLEDLHGPGKTVYVEVVLPADGADAASAW
jgi:signal transduction histidine kinase